MSVRRALALCRRIVDQFRRDHRSLALAFVVPVVVTGLLGWVVRDQETGETRLVVVDADGMAGRRISAALALAARPPLSIESVEADPAEARRLIERGEADVALVVPADFEAAIARGERPALVVVLPGLDPAAESGRAAAVQQLLADALLTALPEPVRVRVPVIERETIYLPADADALDALAPVFLGYFAYFFVFILTGISFLRERLGGTLERLLATPVTRAEIVVGYGLGFGVFATLQVVVLTAFVLGELRLPALGPVPEISVGLGVPTAGSPLLTFAIALLLALGAVNLGIFLSTFARTELQVLQFIPLVIVPQGLLSGIFWPVDALPEPLRPVARAMPLTYAVDGLRDVMIRGAGLADPAIQLDLAVLAAIALVLVALAVRTIRREIV
ncbi:MAG TPA: ABC transporter permease [Candidatus Limnocylindrales bacterium]|nr:ABC transporter permease [Candidatus Limnocylindrales bacterium]